MPQFEKGNKFGGKREGAGRKPDEVKELGAKKEIAAIQDLAFNAQTGEKVRLAALIYLTDRKLGKPKEPREHGGEIVIRIEGYDEKWSK